VHWLVDGHATAVRVSVLIVLGVGVPGEAGLNATSGPPSSTAVHWVVDGHATAAAVEASLLAKIVVGVGLPGDCGLNVV
jgi:hypothetical protein